VQTKLAAAVWSGRWRLDRCLGSGADGTLWAATDLRDDRPVALKVLHAALDETARERLRWEFALLGAIEHPHLVRVFDLDCIDGRPFYTSELLDGAAPTRLAALPPAERAQRLCQTLGEVAGALDALHRRGLVHHDVKPANLLVDGQGRTRLGDLGLAALLGAAAAGGSGGARGTPAYLAPEALFGGGDARVDLYALGATAYELWSGHAPFAAESLAELLAKVQTTRPAPLADAPAGLARLIDRLLALDPAARPSSARAVVDEARRLGARLGGALDSGRSAPLLCRPALAGRDRELAALRAALPTARLILVEGAPGSGRSRLIEEARRAQQLDDVARGRPSTPWRQLADESPARLCAQLAAAPARLHVAEVDEPRVEELLAMVANGAAAPSVVLAEIDPGALARLSGDGVVRLTLDRLDEPAVARLTASMLGQADAELAHAVHRASGGLPRVAVAIVRAAVAAADGQPHANQVGKLEGQGLTALVAAALDRLPAAARALVDAVAVLGRPAPLPEVAALAQTSVSAAYAAALQARVAGALDFDSAGRLQFPSTAHADAAHAALGPRRRLALHRRALAMIGSHRRAIVNPVVGDASSAVVGDTRSAIVGDASSAIVGDTRSAIVGDASSAIVGDTRSAIVGDASSAIVGDTRSAVVGDARSASVGDARSASVGDARSASVGDARNAVGGGAVGAIVGQASAVVGDASGDIVVDIVERAVDQARHLVALADPAAGAAAVAAGERLVERGQARAALRLLADADRLGPDVLPLAAAVVRARALTQTGDYAAALTALAPFDGDFALPTDASGDRAGRAVAATRTPDAKPAGDALLRLDAALVAARALQRAGDLVAAEARLAPILAAGAVAGTTPRSRDDVRGLLGRILVERGAYAEAVAACASSELPSAAVAEARGLGHLYLGQLDDADRAFAAAEAAAADEPTSLARARSLRGMAAHGRDQLADAAALYQSALDLARAADDLHGAAIYAVNLGAVWREQAEYERALPPTADSARDLGRLGKRAERAFALYNYGNLLLSIGDLDGAERAATDAAALARAADATRELGYAQLLAGDLARRRGDRSAAVLAYRAGATTLVTAAARDRLQAALNLAEALAESGDPAAGRAALSDARTLAVAANQVDSFCPTAVRVALQLGDVVDGQLLAELLRLRVRAAASLRRDLAFRADVLAARAHIRAGSLVAASECLTRARSTWEEIRMRTPELRREAADEDPDARRLRELLAAAAEVTRSLPAHEPAQQLPSPTEPPPAASYASPAGQPLSNAPLSNAPLSNAPLSNAPLSAQPPASVSPFGQPPSYAPPSYAPPPSSAASPSSLALTRSPSAAPLARPSQDAAALRRLLGINKRLNSEQRLPVLLDLILDTVLDLTSAERGFILLTDGAGQWQVKAARNIAEEQLAADGPGGAFSRSIAERAAREAIPIVTLDASGDTRFEAALSVSDLKLRSVLAVPLIVKGTVVGCVYADHRLRAGAFGDAEVALVCDLAEQAAIAVENARLLAENERRRKAIDELNRELEHKVASQALELGELHKEVRTSRAALSSRYNYDNLVGRTPRMLELFRLLDRVTETSLPVVIYGESGTGKELVARAIHHNGPRRGRAFVTESCAAIPETLLEAELFGHVRGAFTGATPIAAASSRSPTAARSSSTKWARCRRPCSPSCLRVLQQGEFRRVGGEKGHKVDVRVLVASNRDLGRLVEQGKFREDLFYRLNVVRVGLPPLRERRDDIPLLVEHFLKKFADENKRPPRRIARAALHKLIGYRWPGNVRELENEVVRAASLGGETIVVADLSPPVAAGEPEAAVDSPDDLGLKPRVERLERTLLREALHRADGNQTQAAKLLGLSRFGLQKKLRRYGLEA
jgi:transcriptional regulator with GAF, ATPase, and Fis domain/tetratricopeptide (TPR) repeat protein